MTPNAESKPWPGADHPGVNTELHPDAAPSWLRPLANSLVGEHPAPSAEFERRRARASAHPAPRQAREEQQSAAQQQGSARQGFRGQPSGSQAGAAVLIALAGSSPDTARVLLTHRSPGMRSHAGQIAFPGGRIDSQDVNPVDAALREAWEETGLDRAAVTPIAQLDALTVTRSARPIFPVIAHWHGPARVGVASPRETDHVFTANLAELAQASRRMTVTWRSHTGPAFRCNGYVIWGFTAAVLAGILELGGWAKPWNREPAVALEEALASSRNNEPPR